jgi:outer membrane protein
MHTAPGLNRKNRTFLCMLVLGLALPAPAHAETLTWSATVQEAETNNADLRTALANLQAAGYNASAAYGGLYPQVSAGVGYTDTSGTISSGSGSLGSTTYVGKAYNASVSASQNLFAGFRDSARIEQGAANREVAAASLALAKARVSQALKSAFAGLQFAQNSVTLAASIVQRQEENVRLVELRFESGRENKGSMLLTRASLAQARLSQLQAAQALVTARAQLAQVLGRSEAAELAVSGDVPTAEPAQTPDFHRIAVQAPDYVQASAQEKSASAGVTLARAGLYPSLDLSGSVGRLGSDWFPQDERRSVGLNLTVPIFSGGRDYYTARGAVASLDAASSNKQTVESAVLVNLKQAYANYVQAVEQLKVSQAFLDAAQVRAEIARSQYNNGLISFNDWNLIETDLIQRQTSYLQSQRDRIVAEASWEQAQGKGVIP